MKRLLIFCFLLLGWSCAQYGQLRYVAKLPKSVNECSGIISLRPNEIWLIEDNGNPDNLIAVDSSGQLLQSFKVKDAKNDDWEALTMDRDKHLYIGDFGNNNNKRKNLRIYKVPNPIEEPGDKIDAEKISFHYPDQDSFPPEKNALYYDAEAFFHYNGYLYIINKNRSQPFDGQTRVYRVPDKPGNYAAKLVAQFKTCGDYRQCQVTDATISPDGNRLVLLGYGTLWVFENFRTRGFDNGPTRMIVLGANTQLESVCFINNTVLYLADERSHGSGGNLYSFTVPLP